METHDIADDVDERTVPGSVADSKGLFVRDEFFQLFYLPSTGPPVLVEDEWPIGHEPSSKSFIIKLIGLHQIVKANVYVAKPGEPGTLICRQLSYQINRQERLKFPGLVIDPNCRMVEMDDQVVYLPKTEFELLWFLARHPQQVFTRARLINYVWGSDFRGSENTVTVHISRLRDKIEPDSDQPTYIYTVWGVGYKFAVRN